MLQLPELFPASGYRELRMTSGYICLLFICEKMQGGMIQNSQEFTP